MTRIFASYTQADKPRIAPALDSLPNQVASPEDCDLVLAFVSAAYIADRDAFVAGLSYAACALRKPYILVRLEDIPGPPPDLEMLAAKDGYVSLGGVPEAIGRWTQAEPKIWPAIQTERRYAFKPFEACEEHYAFVSYAHDDAQLVYPIIKDLYEAGWNLWYDEGIRITERYLPEIARHVRDCEVFLLFVTERSLARPFVVDFELAYAKRLGKRVVPVMVEDVAFEQAGVVPPSVGGVLEEVGLRNFGERIAVPPKDKEAEVYDLHIPAPMKDFRFELWGDGIALTEYTGKSRRIEIPEKHIDLPIRLINYPFKNSKQLKSIEIPSNVISIGSLVHTAISSKAFTALTAGALSSMLYLILVKWFDKIIVDWIFNDTWNTILYDARTLMGQRIFFLLMLFLIIYFGVALLLKFILSYNDDAVMVQAWNLLEKYAHKRIRVICPNETTAYRYAKENRCRLQSFDEHLYQKSIAVLYDPNDTSVCQLVQNLNVEGFSLNEIDEKSSPDALLVFLSDKLLQSHATLLIDSVNQQKKLVPIYWSMQPKKLPRNLSGLLGQLQGLFPTDAEFNYQLRNYLFSNGYYGNSLNKFDFYFGGYNQHIVLTSYNGNSQNLFVPDNCFTVPVESVSLNSDNSTVRSITISKNCNYIDGLHHLRALKEISISNANKTYFSLDGVCYQKSDRDRKNRCWLIAFPSGREGYFRIPDDISVIGVQAFHNCLLSELFIPESVDNILPANFADCPNLTIYTPAGSYAERYAREHNIPVINI